MPLPAGKKCYLKSGQNLPINDLERSIQFGRKRHAYSQHLIRRLNGYGIESGIGFEIRNRFVVRPSLCAFPCQGTTQHSLDEHNLVRRHLIR